MGARLKALKQMVGKRGGGEMPSFVHRAQLAYLKLRYRFSKLDLSAQGDKWVINASMNPAGTVDDSLTITDPNKITPGTPPGAQPPVSKGFRASRRGNTRLFATDQAGTEWVWKKKTPTSATQGHWQKTNDDSKIKEAEQEAQKWLESHKKDFVSLVRADKAASEHGADVGGLGQESGQPGKERLYIGEVKLGAGAGPTYFGFKPGDPEANKFTAITTNLESTLGGMRREALERGAAEDKGQEYVERVDAALKSGSVTINIFLKGQARIGETGRSGGWSTFTKVRAYVFRELRRILSAAPYNLSRSQLNKVIKNVKVESPIRI